MFSFINKAVDFADQALTYIFRKEQPLRNTYDSEDDFIPTKRLKLTPESFNTYSKIPVPLGAVEIPVHRSRTRKHINVCLSRPNRTHHTTKVVDLTKESTSSRTRSSSRVTEGPSTAPPHHYYSPRSSRRGSSPQSQKNHSSRGLQGSHSHVSISSTSSGNSDVVFLDDKKIEIIDDDDDVEEVTPSKTSFKLTKSMQEKVKKALNCDPETVVAEGFRLRISQEDLSTLCNSRWLSDNIINFYLQLVCDRNSSTNRRTPRHKDQLPKVLALTSFFYPKLEQSGYRAVRQWTRGRQIFLQDILFIPIHLTVHWALVCVDFRSKTIKCFDSMRSHKASQCLQVLMEFLKEECVDKMCQSLDPLDHWSCEHVKKIPHQENGSDCGVFVCMFAEYLSRDATFDFTQTNMPTFRERIMFEILNRRLLD